MKRKTYKSALKAMNADQLRVWIDKKEDFLISETDLPASTPLLTKIIYAKSLLKKLENHG